jgi:hypothetical protein
MARRLTISLDDVLERALREAPARLHLPRSSSDSERLRDYARRGYETALEEERLATYRRWANEPEMLDLPRAASRRAAKRQMFED